MKGLLLHKGIVSYGKTFVALTRCLQIQLSTTNLVKYIHTRKAQRKSPLTHGYLHTSGGLLVILVEGADAYHYLFVVHTNSGTGGKPIVVHESTTIGHYYEPIVVRTSTNTGRPAELY